MFLAGEVSWINELQSVIKNYNNTIHSSTKMSPIQVFKKQMKKKSIPLFKIEELDRNKNLY